MEGRILVHIILLIFLCRASAVAPADSNEDLRVSSNSFGGNYHSITPDRSYPKSARRVDVINQLGKPLVPVSPTPVRSTVKPAQRQRPSKRPLKQIDKSTRAMLAQPSPVIQQLVHQQPDTTSQNTCRWLTMRQLSNISFDTGELVIRDASDQPCYIITIRAYIKWHEDAYFPLQGYRFPPSGAYKVEFIDANDEQATIFGPQRLLLNCSLPPESMNKNVATVSLMSAQRSSRPFAEEITIQVSCGYLVLRLRGSGAYLSLETISFYQVSNVLALEVDGTSSGSGSKGFAVEDTARAGPGAQQISPAAPATTSPKRSVFTTEGMPDLSPLIVMPTFSRYICQHHIELAGNNSVQLVISRFELKRLTNEPVVQSQSPLEGDAVNGQQEMRYAGRDTSADTRPRRDAHSATILYRDPLISETRCPNPKAPGVPLKTMMDRGNSQRNDTMDGSSSANKWVSSGEASAFLIGASCNWLTLSLVTILNAFFGMRGCYRVHKL